MRCWLSIKSSHALFQGHMGGGIDFSGDESTALFFRRH